MAVLLALCSAALYGTGDFLGGLSSRRVPALLVLGASQVIGLAIGALLAVVLGGDLTPADTWWAAAGGLTGAAGVGLLYRLLVGRDTGPRLPTLLLAVGADRIRTLLTPPSGTPA